MTKGTVRAALAPYNGEVAISALNAPASVAVSGRADVVEQIIGRLQADGVEARRLTVSHAFHSPLMEPILDRFEETCAAVSLAPPRIPLASNLSGAIAGEEIAAAGYWRAQLRSPVRFADER